MCCSLSERASNLVNLQERIVYIGKYASGVPLTVFQIKGISNIIY